MAEEKLSLKFTEVTTDPPPGPGFPKLFRAQLPTGGFLYLTAWRVGPNVGIASSLAFSPSGRMEENT
jgi:hypothetical protein